MRRIAIRLIAGGISGIVLFALWQAAVLIESRMRPVTPLFFDVHNVLSVVASAVLAAAITAKFDVD